MRDIRTLDRLIDERAKGKEWRRYRGRGEGGEYAASGRRHPRSAIAAELIR
jgi:hypothetical protein